MEKELIAIFQKTINAHHPTQTGITQTDYWMKFKTVLAREMVDAPRLDTDQGNLATYMKLSVLVMAMINVYEDLGLSEYEIGEYIYRTADAYFHMPPARTWIQHKLFFSRWNKRQILKRQEVSQKSENGINGFKIQYVAGNHPSEFGVDYVKCGICEYFARKNKFRYVKYCCLVDYAIMKNMGIAFTRTTTLGNGGEICDFRFAKKGEIEEGWPPNRLQEFNQS